MKDQFDDWVQGAIPDVQENEVKKEIHLAILKERMRAKHVLRRRRSLRTGMVVVPLVVLILLIGNVVELGGGSFDVVELEDPKIVDRIFKIGFGGWGFNASDDDTDEEIQEFGQQFILGDGVVVGLTGWNIDGVQTWSIIREYNIFGEIKTTSMLPEGMEQISKSELIRLIDVDWETLDRMVESGEYPPEVTEEIELNGMLFSAQRWSLPTEDYGTVIHYEGVPISAVFLPQSLATVEEASFGSVKAMNR